MSCPATYVFAGTSAYVAESAAATHASVPDIRNKTVERATTNARRPMLGAFMQ
jgi:hypothetical protein